MSAFWTDERIDEMMRLHREGQSTAAIARLWHVSKNSIVGKLYREKVKRGLLVGTPRLRTRSSTVVKPKAARRVNMPTLPGAASFVLPMMLPPVKPPDEGQFASILDVTGCRWPVREDRDFVGGHAFCNNPKGNHSYCEFHQRMNREKNPPRYLKIRVAA